MDDFHDLLKKPWVWIAGGALLLVLLLRQNNTGASASSAASQAYNAGVYSQQVADQTNIQLAQGQYALAAVQDQVQGQQNVAALQTYGNLAGSIMSLIAGNNQTAAGIANNVIIQQNAVPLATIASQEQLGLATINGNVNENIAQTQASQAEAIATTNADAYQYAVNVNRPYYNTGAGQFSGYLSGIGGLLGGGGGGGGGGGLSLGSVAGIASLAGF